MYVSLSLFKFYSAYKLNFLLLLFLQLLLNV